MLKIVDVEKRYHVGDKEIIGVTDVNITINQGEFVSILGRSGCGKTTLLNCIAGIDRASNGYVFLNEEDLLKISDDEYASIRAKKIGYIFQNYNLIEHMSALKNVLMALNHVNIPRREKKEKALRCLELVGMKKYAGKRPGKLSGGEKQRVAIARALVSDPEIILADEPTGALDSKNCEQIMNLLKKINEEKKISIIMVTHNEDLAKQTDRIIKMADGKVVSDEMLIERIDNGEPIENRESLKSLKAMEALGLAIHNAMSKKKRTFVLAISTSIGIAGVMLVMGIGLGTKLRISREFEKNFNSNVLNAIRMDDFKFSDTTIEDIQSWDEVSAVYPSYAVDIYAGSGEKECSLEVLCKETEEATERILTEGSLPSSDAEILISEKLSQKLTGSSGKDAIGSKIETTLLIKSGDGIPCPVQKTLTISGLGDTAMFGVAESAYITFDSMEKVAKEAGLTAENGSNGFTVIIENKKDRQKVIDKLWDLGLDAKKADLLPSKFLKLIDAVVYVLVFISIISVIVSAVMICLISYMNVTERTKEIGILKAMGYQKKEIEKIFLSEGTLVGTMAGIFGIVASTIIGNAINNIFTKNFASINFAPYKANPIYIIVCIAASMLVGTICSKSAAGKAAKLNPLKALGYI